jgi:hypothetical protein
MRLQRSARIVAEKSDYLSSFPRILEGVVNQYLAAVIAPGDGFWKTAEGRGKYTHVFADPEGGQVAYMGTMMEAGGPILMSLRLRLELGRITEIESVYFKPGGGGPNNIANMDAPHVWEDYWFKSIPPAQRMSRQELIAVADGYFTGLQKNDGKGINGTGTYPFTEDCHRIENGALTTNVKPNLNAPPPGAATGGRGGAAPTAAPLNPPNPNINANAMDCLSQFKLGYYFVVQNIHDRRYPVVDQERGIVWAHAIFDQGTVNSGILSTRERYTFPGFNRPSSIQGDRSFPH